MISVAISSSFQRPSFPVIFHWKMNDESNVSDIFITEIREITRKVAKVTYTLHNLSLCVHVDLFLDSCPRGGGGGESPVFRPKYAIFST